MSSAWPSILTRTDCSGDKLGYLGVIDVEEEQADKCVVMYRPHVRPISSSPTMYQGGGPTWVTTAVTLHSHNPALLRQRLS